MRSTDTGFRKGFEYLSTNSGTWALENDYSTRHQVIAGAMLKGNFRDPLPWSYIIKDEHFPRGMNNHWWRYANGESGFSNRNGCISFDGSHPLFDGLAPFPSDLYNLALSRLNDRIRGSLDLSVDLFQAGKTAKMLNAIGRIREYTNQTGWHTLWHRAARGDSSVWRNVTRLAANARLEYVYGWKPLANALYGALDESQRLVLNQLKSFQATASRQIPGTTGTCAVINYGAVPTTVDRKGKWACKISVTLKSAAFDPARWASLNPISWAYELTPYSFVLDWMIDVGSYIRNLETALLYDNRFVSGFVSYLTAADCTGKLRGTRVTIDNPVYYYDVTGEVSGRYVEFNRTPLNGYPLPRLPSFKADLGANRLLNLAALIGQRVGHHPKP